MAPSALPVISSCSIWPIRFSFLPLLLATACREGVAGCIGCPGTAENRLERQRWAAAGKRRLILESPVSGAGWWLDRGRGGVRGGLKRGCFFACSIDSREVDPAEANDCGCAVCSCPSSVCGVGPRAPPVGRVLGWMDGDLHQVPSLVPSLTGSLGRRQTAFAPWGIRGESSKSGVLPSRTLLPWGKRRG